MRLVSFAPKSSLVSLAATVALMGGGLWLSRGLGTVQVWLYGAGMIALVGISAESYVSGTYGIGLPWERRGLAAWSAATLLALSGLWMAQAAPIEWLWPVALGMAVVAGGHVLSLKEGLDGLSRFTRQGRFASNVITFLLVFILFALIYGTKLRAMTTATSTGLVAIVASLELLRAGDELNLDWGLAILAGITGLLIAEATWLLGYWPVGGLVGGAILLLGYYVLVGLLQCIRNGSFGRNAVIEYGAVAAVGFLAILIVVP